MKAKVIEKILRHKFGAFIKSIEDKEVQRLVAQNSIITGGSIVSLVLNEKVNDYDIYFTTRETVLAVCKYYQELLVKENLMFENVKIDQELDENGLIKPDGRIKFRIQSKGIVDKIDAKGKKYFPIIITDNAISLTNEFQLILRFYGPAEEIHRNYDFIHVKSYWESSNGKLHFNPDSLECILTKELRYTGSLYPLASIFRLRKFLSRGWTISAGDIFKMAFQASQLNFKDPKVMYDQLIGVDIHYFQQMIFQIEEDLTTHKITEVDQNYLSDLIEKIFHNSEDFTYEDYVKNERSEEKNKEEFEDNPFNEEDDE
jgi:hypothetical protein